MRQRRTVAAALDYIRALSREARRTAGSWPASAGHEGPHRIQALLSRQWMVVGGAPRPAAGAGAGDPADDPDDLTGKGLAIDETAHLRKGKSTACVSPQHAGLREGAAA